METGGGCAIETGRGVAREGTPVTGAPVSTAESRIASASTPAT